MVAPAKHFDRAWLTPEEAGAELGCAPKTVRKRMGQYGGYRVGRLIRLDRKTVLASKSAPDLIHKPNASVQQMAAELEAQAVLNKQRHLQLVAQLEQLTKRIAQLESAQKLSTPLPGPLPDRGGEGGNPKS
jgi:hypothetical protein